MSEQTREQSIGALWANETRDGAMYFKGTVEIAGERVEIVVFKNGYKQDSKHPDYRIYRSRPRPQEA